MWYLMRCYCFTIPTDLEFKQRQPEVERSQVTMSLKLGQGAYGEVSSWCKRCLAANCWYFLTLRLTLPSSLSLFSSNSLSFLSSLSFFLFLPLPPTSHPSSRSPPSLFSPPLPSSPRPSPSVLEGFLEWTYSGNEEVKDKGRRLQVWLHGQFSS